MGGGNDEAAATTIQDERAKPNAKPTTGLKGTASRSPPHAKAKRNRSTRGTTRTGAEREATKWISETAQNAQTNN